MSLTAAELKAVFAVDDTELDKALRGLPARVRSATSGIPDIALDADTRAAEAKVSGLDTLVRGMPDGQVEVLADTARAEGDLDGLSSAARGLPDAELEVTADTSKADSALSGLNRDAAEGGKDAGAEAGDGLAAGVIAAIATIPVAGAVVGIGAAIGKAMLSGLGNEVREDTLVAKTGLDPAVASRIGTAAGEAYAGNFGESIEANFDTARAALQSGLLDTDSTGRDSQLVIEQLTGVATVLGEDIPRVSRAVGVILKNGLAKDATEAFDILVKGQQAGANEAEDLLDTFTEYPAVLAKLGLSGEESLNLLSQGLQAGARDSDFVADALKEFQIRATDASEASAAGYELIGLSAEGMTAKIAAGGQGAKEGLQQVLDGLRNMEDPVKRNEAAVALFGTKAEDLGDALFALDLNATAEGLDRVEGAAAGAISTLGDNAAGELESARRNIEVAADGIQGALAAAFGPQISDFADLVRTNRTAVVEYLLDMANAALDVGRSLVEAAASGIEGFGDFVGNTGPQVLDLIDGILAGLDSIPFVDLSQAREEFATVKAGALDSFSSMQFGSEDAAKALRENLIENGIDPTQAKLNELGIDQVKQAQWSDATTRLASAVSDIGLAADGTTLAVDNTGGSFDRTTGAGARLDGQIRSAVASLGAQVAAGQAAGRSTDDLTADYNANRDSLIASIEAMGFSNDEARALADAYGAVPGDVRTEFTTPGSPRAADEADRVRARVSGIPTSWNSHLTVSGGTAAAREADMVRAAIANIPSSKTSTLYTQRITTETRRDAAMAGRAWLGGPVEPGAPYIVGEEGRELFVPDRPGTIIDASQTAGLLGQTPSGAVGGSQASRSPAATSAPSSGGPWLPDSVALYIDGERFDARVVRVSADGARHADRMYQGS